MLEPIGFPAVYVRWGGGRDEDPSRPSSRQVLVHRCPLPCSVSSEFGVGPPRCRSLSRSGVNETTRGRRVKRFHVDRIVTSRGLEHVVYPCLRLQTTGRSVRVITTTRCGETVTSKQNEQCQSCSPRIQTVILLSKRYVYQQSVIVYERKSKYIRKNVFISI